MSNLQRLMSAAEKDPVLSEKLSILAPDELVRWAESMGYFLTMDEAISTSASYQELSDDDLKQVAGGWSSPQS